MSRLSMRVDELLSTGKYDLDGAIAQAVSEGKKAK